MAKTVANTTKQEKFPDFTFFSCWYKIRNMQQNKMRIVALSVLLHSLVYKEESLMKITDTIKYVGVNDHQVDLFRASTKCRTACPTTPM